MEKFVKRNTRYWWLLCFRFSFLSFCFFFFVWSFTLDVNYFIIGRYASRFIIYFIIPIIFRFEYPLSTLAIPFFYAPGHQCEMYLQGLYLIRQNSCVKLTIKKTIFRVARHGNLLSLKINREIHGRQLLHKDSIHLCTMLFVLFMRRKSFLLCALFELICA